MTETDISLGDSVQDRLSGFCGIVTTVGEHLAGCTRIGVTPCEVGETQRGEEEFFYPAQLTTVSVVSFPDVSEDAEQAITETSEVELGQLVQDEVTGLEGYVSVINYKLWNCPQVLVTPPASSDVDDASWVDEPRLNVRSNAFSGEYDDKTEEAETGCSADSRDRNLSVDEERC